MKPQRHEWRLLGGGGGWEVWECARCGRTEIPSAFGFMWSDLGRLLHRRWQCSASLIAADLPVGEG